MTSYLRQINKLEFSDIKSCLLFALAFIPSLILRIFKRNIWLCCERITIADDNAWIFYNWVRKNYGSDNIYFVIDHKSINFNRTDSHIIAWGSFRHYVYYLSSNIHIMAMFQTPAPNLRVSSHLNRFLKREINKIYLRHGICKDGMEKHRYDLHHFRLFICGAKPEYEYVKKEGGYPEQNVKYTGFARFDELLQEKRDEGFILILPTWRLYNAYDKKMTRDENEKKFKETKFYQYYNSLLNDSSFDNFLRKYNLKVRFCLHAEFRCFKDCFSFTSSNIDFVKDGESIHHLLMTTSLLITDYSSVFFDVAYMNKPIVFYHFDYSEFRQKHLSEGYFSYEEDGMGPIAHNEKELMEFILSSYSNRGFYMENKYLERTRRFFPLQDSNNCQRIYNEIKLVEEHD